MESLDKKAFVEKIFQVDGEINVVHQNIKNNILALKKLKELQKNQLAEVKKMWKTHQISRKEFNLEQEMITTFIAENLNQISEELTYNTSFIVQKYDEWAELNSSEFGKELHSTYKNDQKRAQAQIKYEKKLEKERINTVIKDYQETKTDKQVIKRLKLMRKNVGKKIDKKHHFHIKKLEKNLNSTKTSPKSNLFMILLGIIVPVSIALSLTINYLVYYPQTNNEDFDLTNSNSIIAFSISMLMVVIALGFTTFVIVKATKRIVIDREQKMFKIATIGFNSGFLDAIGVGSFATTMAQFKATKAIKNDKLLPGTLNIGLAIPILLEGSIFVSAVQVQILTLVILVLSAIVGSYIGATIVNKINTAVIKLITGVGLFVIAIVMILTHPDVNILPSGNATGLDGWKLTVAAVVFLVLGGLMSFGIGLYAPAMGVIVLLGMDIKVVFPIMMCSSAFLMPINSLKFFKDNNFLPKTSLSLTIGAVIGSQISFLLVFVGLQVGLGVSQEVFKGILTWIAIVVIFYTALSMIYEYVKLKQKPKKLPTTTQIDVTAINDANSYKDRISTIQQQITTVVEEYANHNIDTKKRVEDEKMAITKWIDQKDI